MTQFTRGGFALPGTSLNYKTGTWRIQMPEHRHRAAPCHAACPAGEDPQAYIARLDSGDARGAWETLVQANPLPSITGRVCQHPCEQGCNRGSFDSPIAIHNIERFLGDQAIANDWTYPVTLPPADAPRVAVIGAGPAGLSAAYHLMRLGCRPTLFAATSEAGGTLRAIPGYRLPIEVVDAEINRLLATGIDFRPGQRLGRDIYLTDLQDEYEAVFLGPGTQQSREWSVQGAVPTDLHEGLHLLKEWMSVGNVPPMQSAVVVGGGNTAVDVCRILRRAGVKDVHLVTHNGLPGSDTLPENTMKAIPREIEQALEEGVQIHDHRGIRRLILRGEKITGVEMVRMKGLRDAKGQMQRVAFEGTESILHVDQVIPAIGQMVNPTGLERLLNGDALLRADDSGQIPGHRLLFVGGDARKHSPGSVTAAVGDGRRAAIAMHARIEGRKTPDLHAGDGIVPEELNLHYFEPAERAVPTTLSVEQRTCEEEIEGGLTRGQAGHEAKRCLCCGSCLNCDNCWTLCPDSAVLKTPTLLEDGSHYVFDYDYCKGCGLCATECPTGFIRMREDL